MKINTLLEAAWQDKNPILRLLLPFSWLYLLIITLRRKCYDWGFFRRQAFQVPVIVVGNILVGGTGKTPFVIALVEYLQKKGMTIGVVSRGYKADCKVFPHEVLESEEALFTGDEPALIKRKTQAFVVIDPDRPRGIQFMIDQHKPDVIICDDGLQHYALMPGFTIVIHPKDAEFYPHCLPAGPLREPLSRLKSFDMLVDNLEVVAQPLDLDPSWRYTLVTSIARPDRVQHYLAQMGIDVEHISFSDHHTFISDDFLKISGPIIMTEKDEVKCETLMIAQPVHVVRVKTVLSQQVKQAVNQYLGIAS